MELASVSARLANRLHALSEEYSLTHKEVQIFKHLAVGIDAKEIAQKEDITYETARWYIKQVYQKLGINKQTELMRLFIV